MVLLALLLACDPLTVEAETTVYVFDLADTARLCEEPDAAARTCAGQGRAVLTYDGPGVVEVRPLDGVAPDAEIDGMAVEAGALHGESWRLAAGETASATVIACVSCFDGDVPDVGEYPAVARWGAFRCRFGGGDECKPEREPSAVAAARVVTVLE